MKKVLPGLLFLLLSALFVNAQSKSSSVKKKSSKNKDTVATQSEKLIHIVEMPADEAVMEAAPPAVVDIVEETSTVSERENSSNVSDGEPFYIQSNLREKNLIIAYQGSEYDNRRYALLEYFSKKKITPFIFESMSGFYDGNLSQVRLNSKYGAINGKGQMVIPCIYEEMTSVTLDGLVYRIVNKNGRYGIINDQNEVVIPFEYDNISKPYNSSLLLQVGKNGKIGLMNFVSRKIVIPMLYDYISVNSANVILVKKGKMYSLFNLTGEKIFSNWYTHLELIGRDNEFAIAELNGKKGLINLTEKKIIPLEYDELTRTRSRYSSTMFFIANKGGRYGIIGADGKIVLPLQYEQITAGYDMVIVTKNNKKGLLSTEGKFVLPIEYDEISDIDRYFLVRKDKKCGLVNRDGASVLPVEYDALNHIIFVDNSSSYLAATKSGKKGIVDAATGKPVVNLIYDDLIGVRRSSYSSTESFNNSIIAVKSGKYGMIELNENILVPFVYDDLQYLNSFVVIAGKNGKYGIVDIYHDNNVLLPLEYQFISHKNGVIIAYKESYEKYRLNGNKITKMGN